MREIAVSGDRLYRFVVLLTGSMGESAESAIAWEDQQIAQFTKKSQQYREKIQDTVNRFHTRLVESTLSSTLKASRLQLDVRGREQDNELVVVSADATESARRVVAGEAGHGFFEASVALQNFMQQAEQPMGIGAVVKLLSQITNEYRATLASSAALSAGEVPSSYNRMAEPRNSFMIHLKPDVSAAIQKSFDHVTVELRACPGWHRHLHLWELVEGKDWVLCSRFAELVGMMLQNTRMRAGSYAAYVGQAQIITNAHNIRRQLMRVVDQACAYLASEFAAPSFLVKGARSRYFGGTDEGPAENSDGAKKRKLVHIQNDKALRRLWPGHNDDDDDEWMDTERARMRSRRWRYNRMSFNSALSTGEPRDVPPITKEILKEDTAAMARTVLEAFEAIEASSTTQASTPPQQFARPTQQPSPSSSPPLQPQSTEASPPPSPSSPPPLQSQSTEASPPPSAPPQQPAPPQQTQPELPPPPMLPKPSPPPLQKEATSMFQFLIVALKAVSMGGVTLGVIRTVMKILEIQDFDYLLQYGAGLLKSRQIDQSLVQHAKALALHDSSDSENNATHKWREDYIQAWEACLSKGMSVYTIEIDGANIPWSISNMNTAADTLSTCFGLTFCAHPKFQQDHTRHAAEFIALKPRQTQTDVRYNSYQMLGSVVRAAKRVAPQALFTVAGYFFASNSPQDLKQLVDGSTTPQTMGVMPAIYPPSSSVLPQDLDYIGREKMNAWLNNERSMLFNQPTLQVQEYIKRGDVPNMFKLDTLNNKNMGIFVSAALVDYLTTWVYADFPPSTLLETPNAINALSLGSHPEGPTGPQRFFKKALKLLWPIEWGGNVDLQDFQHIENWEDANRILETVENGVEDKNNAAAILACAMNPDRVTARGRKLLALEKLQSADAIYNLCVEEGSKAAAWRAAIQVLFANATGKQADGELALKNAIENAQSIEISGSGHTESEEAAKRTEAVREALKLMKLSSESESIILRAVGNVLGQEMDLGIW